jgi:hypothetical protein
MLYIYIGKKNTIVLCNPTSLQKIDFLFILYHSTYRMCLDLIFFIKKPIL